MKKSLFSVIFMAFLASASVTTAQIQMTFSVVQPTCHGFTNGSATVYPVGGTGAYKYLWSNAQTTQTTFGIGKGAYTVTVTDAAQNTASGQITVSEPSAVTTTITASNLNCTGNSGLLTATGFGGTPPFTYAWDGPGGPSSFKSIPVVAPGNYFLTITDANHCSGVGAYTVPLPLSVDVTAVDIPCSTYPQGGSAFAVATGGTTPYVYSWSNGAHSSFITGISGGQYTCTVTSANGCTAVDADMVDIPDPLITIVVWQTPSCGNTNNGTATVKASGGTPPYTYNWTGGYPSGPSQTGLAPGQYYVCTFDSNLCQKDLWVIIPHTDSLDVNLVITSATCVGVNIGTATAVVAPPGSGYIYQWNILPPDSNVVQVTGLSAGTLVSVTVTDPVSGCTGTASGVVGAHTSIDIAVTDVDILCAGGFGSATAVASNGNPPYSYTWFSNGVPIGNNASISGLNPGAYLVTVVDSLGCEAQAVADISIQSAPNASISGANVLLCGDSLTVVKFTNQSTDPYNVITTLTWIVTGPHVDTVINQQSQVVFQLPVDDTIKVQLIATSALGCADTATLVYNVPGIPNFTLSLDSTSINCTGDSTRIDVINGDPSYTYVWNPAVTFHPNPLHVWVYPTVTTTYVLTATDGNACTASDSITIDPAGGLFQLFVSETLIQTCSDSAVLFASTSIPTTIVWSLGGVPLVGNPVTVPATPIPTIYTVTAFTSDSCFLTEQVSVTGYAIDLSLDPNAVYTICEGGNLPLSVIVTPMSDSLEYQWTVNTPAVLSNPNAPNPTLSGPVGTYTVTVIVTNVICSDTLSFPVVIVPGENLDGQIEADLCKGLEVTFTNNSGIGGSWNFGDGSPVSTVLNPVHIYSQAGQYHVVFTPTLLDCVAPWDSVINVMAAPLAAAISSNYINCVNQADIQFNGTSNNTGTFSWDWTFTNGSPATASIQNPIISFTQEGSILATLVVVDVNGCPDTVTLPVDIAFVNDSIPTPAPICAGESVQLNPNGIDLGATYLWTAVPADSTLNPNDPNPTVTPLVPTVYTVVINQGLCSVTYSVSVTFKPGGQVSLPDDMVVCSNDLVSVTAQSPGATGFEWSVSPTFAPIFATTQTVLVAPNGTYYVRVTGPDCDAVDSIHIQYTPFELTVAEKIIQTCNTTATLSATTNIPATITWSNGITTLSGNTVTVPATPVTTIWTVTALTADSCLLSDQVSVTGVGIEVSLDPNAVLSVCEGSSLPLSVIVTPMSANLTYQWSVTAPGILDNSTIANPTLSGPVGTYTVTVIVTNLICADTLSFPVQILEDANLDGQIEVDLCKGLEVIFTNNSGIGGSWNFGDGSPVSTVLNPVHIYSQAGQYHVVFTPTLLDCVAPWDSVINVMAAPLAAAISSNYINCVNQADIQFNGTSNNTGTFSWDWTFTNGSPATASVQNPVVTFTQEGSILATLVVVDVNGCPDTVTLPVDIAFVNDSIPTPAPICAGESVQLNPNGIDLGATYLWTAVPADSTLNPNDPNPTVTPLVPTVYTVVINQGLCSVTYSVSVTFKPGGQVSLPDDMVVCSNDLVSVTAQSPGATGFEWSVSPTFVPIFATTQTVLVAPNGTYYVRVTGPDCDAVDSIHIQYTPFELTVAEKIIQTCNTTATLSASTNIPATITWSNGITTLSGNTVTVPATPVTTIWTVTAWTADSCLLSDQVSVTGIGIEVSLDPNAVLSVCEGSTLPLSVIVTPMSANLTYQWSVTAPGILDNSTIANPTLSGPVGTYTVTVIVTNLICADTLSFPVQILEDANLDGQIEADLCKGLEVTFTNNSGIGGSWNFGDGSPVSTVLNPVHIYSQAGQYHVVFTPTLLDCVAPWDSVINVMAAPLAAAISSNYINCVNQADIQFNGTSNNAGTFSWDWTFTNGSPATASVQNPVVTFTQEGSILATLVVVDVNGCPDTVTLPVDIAFVNDSIPTPAPICAGESIQLNPNGVDLGATYLWTAVPADSTLNPNDPNPTVTPLVPTVYTVVINQGLCSVTYSVSVTFKPGGQVSLPDDMVVCSNDLVSVTAQSPGATGFEWSVSPTFAPIFATTQTVLVAPNGTYYVRVTGPDCDAVDSIHIQYTPFELTVAEKVIQTCNATATLSASTNIPATITWSNGITTLSGNTVTVPATPVTTIWTVTALTADSCLLSDQVSVTGIGIEVSLDPNAVLSVCEGSTLPLSVIVTPMSANLTYQWSVTAPGILDNSTIANPTLSGPVGTYTVTVIVTNLICADTLSFPVQILEDANLDGQIEVDLCKGLEVIFTNNSGIGGSWNFGDGSPVSTVLNPVHIYSQAGQYHVVFTPTLLDCVAPWDSVINVMAAPLAAAISSNYINCVNQADIQFNGTSNNTGTFSWDWTFTNGTPATASIQNPIISFTQEGSILATLVVVDVNGCPDTVTLPVDIAFVNDSIPTPAPICAGESIQLNPNGIDLGATYLWTAVPADSTLNPNDPNPTVTPLVPTVYTVVINQGLCSVTYSVSVTFKPGGQVSLPDDMIVCSNDLVSVTAQSPGATGFEWSVSPTFIPIFATTQTVLVAPNGTYYVRVSGPDCDAVDSIHIQYSPFELTVAEKVIQTCNATATLSASTNIPATITWSNGITTLSGNTVTVPATPVTTIWTVTALTADSCLLSDQVSVTGIGIEVSLDPNAVLSVCEGSTLPLSVIVTPMSANLTYQWSVTAPGILDNSTIANPTLSGPVGTYTVTVIVTNLICADTLSFPVQILEDANLDGQIEVDLCKGLEVTFTNNSGIGGSWNFGDGSPVSTVLNPVHIYSQAGQYHVVFTPTLLDCVAPWDSVINVIAAPLAAAISSNYINCVNQADIQFNGTSNNTGTFSWDWTFTNGSPATASIQNPVVTFTQEGSILATLVVVDVNGCPDTVTLPVDIAFVNDSIPTPAPICAGESVQLNPNGIDLGATYLWTAVPADPTLNPNDPNPTVTPLVPTVYTVVINQGLCSVTYSVSITFKPGGQVSLPDDMVVCSNDLVSVTAESPGATGFEWSVSPTFVPIFATTQTVLVAPNGTYYVRVTGPDCTAVDSIHIQYSPFELTVAEKIIQTCNTTATLSASTNIPATITWSDGITTLSGNTVIVPATPVTTIWTVTALTADSCLLSDQVSVTGIGIEVSLDPNAVLSVCVDSSLPLSVIVTPMSANLTYQWSVTAPGILDNSSIANPTLSGPAGTYTVTVIVTNVICADTLSFPVQILEDANLDGQIEVDLCKGLEVTFTNNSGIGGSWNFGDGSPVSTVLNPVHIYSQAGQYPVVFTPTLLDCVAPWDSVINVMAAPLAATISSNYINCVNQADIQFNGTSNNTGTFSWDWTFTNGSPATASIQNPVVIFTQEGSILATLVVVDINGCSDTVTLPVDIAFVNDSIPTPAPICAGESVQLNPNGIDLGATYLWTAVPADSTLNPNDPNPTVTPLVPTVYTVVINQGLCSVTYSVSVTFKPGGYVILPDDIVVCSDDLVSVTAKSPGAIGFEWSTSSTFNPIFATTETVLVQPNGTYYVRVNGPECTVIDSIHIGFGSLALQVLPVDITCAGGFGSASAIASNGTPQYTYSWFNASGVQIGSSDSITGLSPGVYTVSVIDSTGCTAQGVANIDLLSDPYALIDSSNILVICGDSLSTVQFNSLSSDPYNTIANITWTISWSGIDTVINQSGQITLQLPVHQTVTVQLVATSSLGCSDTTIMEYHVPGIPDITLSLDSTSINCTGDPLSITVSGGNPAYTYDWNPAVTPNPDSLHVLVNPTATTTYILTTSDGGACTAIDSITLEPVTGLFELTVIDSLIQTCSDSVTLFASTSVPATIVWSQGGVPLIGNPVTVPATSDPTIYVVTALTADNCSRIDQVVVTGYQIEANLDPNAVYTVCEGNSLPLSVIVTPLTGNLTYLWSVNAPALLSDSTAANPSLSGPVGVYTVTVIVTNLFCADTVSFPVEIVPSFDLEGHIEMDLCTGLQVSFTNDSGMGGTWNFGDGSPSSTVVNPVHLYGQAGQYHVVFTPTILDCVAPWDSIITIYPDTLWVDIAHMYVDCALKAVIQFNGSANNDGVFTWDWKFSNGTPATANVQDPIITYTDEGIYVATLAVTDINHCIAIATDSVKVDIVNDVIDGMLWICPGDSVQLNPVGIDSSAHYFWISTPFDPTLEPNDPNPTVTPLVPTTYTVEINQALCSVTYSVDVKFKPGSDVYLSVHDTITCSADPLSITAQSNGATGYEWSDTSNFFTIFATTQTVQLLPNHTYYVRTTGADCPDMDSIRIILIQPEIQVVPTDYNICLGDTTSLMVINLIPDQILHYTWNPPLPDVPNPIVSPSETTTYTVTVTNQYGCTDTLVFPPVHVTTVTVDAQVIGLDTILLGDSTILLAIPGGNGTVITYSWTPTGTLSHPDSAQTHAWPSQTQIYTVIVTTEDGCIATDTVVVYLRQNECISPFVFIPKAFTPNHDQKNDLFRVRADGMTALKMIVWDRWGEVVYETNDPNDPGWDGTLRGKELTPDSYVWYVKLTCGNGDIFESKGNVTLLK